MLKFNTGTSTWVSWADLSSRLLLTDVGWPSLEPSILSLELPQQGLPVQAKLNRLKIWQRVWECFVLSSTALNKFSSKSWADFLLVFHSKELGAVSMSLTVSTSKCFQSLPNNSWPLESQNWEETLCFSSTKETLTWSLAVVYSLPWTQVTQEEHNFQTILRFYSDLSVWWFPITDW